ncbi:MAG: J domain-containing protein [Planctomycetes bacterium]|nr:J domain-containing protein [Planctomycetota bacterium]
MAFPTAKGIRCEHCQAARLQDAVEIWVWDPDPIPVVELGCHDCLRRMLLKQAWLSWRPWNLLRYPLLSFVAFFKNLSLGLFLRMISPTKWLRDALGRENISYQEFQDSQGRPGLNEGQRIEVGNALCVLLLSVGHADGTLAEREWASIRTGLRALYAPEPAVFAGLNLPDARPNAPDQGELEWAAVVLQKRLRRVDHGLVCHLLLSVAERVGGVTEAERIALIWIAQQCGFSSDLLEKALRGTGRFDHRAHSKVAASLPESGAWAVLGLDPGTSKANIRERYRELALENHPDRHAHLGDAMIQAATKRMSAINAAYRELRSKKRWA